LRSHLLPLLALSLEPMHILKTKHAQGAQGQKGLRANDINFIKSNNINHHNNLIYDNHNKEISLKFKQ
jgi:hypothetical protein